MWHICHTKHKNGALWDVSNLENYTTWLQYRCKFATVRIDVVKVLLFYIPFSLSSLFIFFFSLLSHSPVPSLFGQSEMFTVSNDGVASTTTARFATLDLADLTLRPLSISPSSLSSLSAFHSTSLWLWVLFGCLFVCLFVAIWVDLILVSNCGGWFAVEVGCSGGDGGF